jgi:hypothetical protein
LKKLFQMNASPVDSRRPPRVAILLGFVALALVAGPGDDRAWGQSTQASPVTLVPRGILGAAPLTAPDIVPEPTSVTSVRPKPRGAAIEVNRLAEIAPESLGVLGVEDGGFGIDMWRGTPRDVIEALLQRLPPRMPSRGMRDLARRLLLSVAPPPAAKPQVLASTSANASALSAPGAGASTQLLTARARLLAELGEIPALITLLSVIPGHLEQESLDRLHVEALFLSHEPEEACRRTRNSIAVYHQEAFWQKAMVFCNMAGGDLDRGMLGLDLLRELGTTDDALFFALANRFAGVEEETLPAAEILSPLHVAMLMALEAPFPEGSLENAAPGVLFAMATAPKMTGLKRVAAAELACAQGIIDGAALGRGYDAMPFAPEQLGNAIGAAAGLEAAAARALLYQAARRETLPVARAEVLRVALEAATRTNLYVATSEVYGPLIAEIAPSPQMAWFVETAGRALYGARRLERANDWLALGREESIINPRASAAVVALWPYARLAGGETLAAEGGLEAWSAMREAAGSEVPSGATGLLRASFQALGEFDSLNWNDIAAQSDPFGKPMPSAAFLYALEDASEARRIGETVLLSLIVLGEAGPVGAHSVALGTVISSLGRIGLEREARALAIEAALGNGI